MPTTIRSIVLLLALSGLPAAAYAQGPPVSDTGWVVIPVDEYRALRLKAYPPDPPAVPPPVDATMTRVDYELRVNGESASGEARLTVDVLKEGWVRVEIPAGLLVRAARVDGRVIPLIDAAGAARAAVEAGAHRALARRRRAGAADRRHRVADAARLEGRRVAARPGGRARRPRRRRHRRCPGGAPGERTRQLDRLRPARLAARGLVEAAHRRRAGAAGAEVARQRHPGDRARRGDQSDHRHRRHRSRAGCRRGGGRGAAGRDDRQCRVRSARRRLGHPPRRAARELPRAGAASHHVHDRRRDADTSRRIHHDPDGPAAGGRPRDRRHRGGGAGRRRDRRVRAARPRAGRSHRPGRSREGRESPSMQAYRFRAQAGSAPRSLTLSVARYTPQAVLVANVEEARYDALVDEQGKTLVRARYAVRNNQRAFLAVTLPAGSTLWTAAVGNGRSAPAPRQTARSCCRWKRAAPAATLPSSSSSSPTCSGCRPGPTRDRPRWRCRRSTCRSRAPASACTTRRGSGVAPEPGAFRVEGDVPPFHEALNTQRRAAAGAGQRAEVGGRARRAIPEGCGRTDALGTAAGQAAVPGLRPQRLPDGGAHRRAAAADHRVHLQTRATLVRCAMR